MAAKNRGKLLALPAGRVEPGLVLDHVPPRPPGKLTAVVLALADDAGDLVVAVVEDVVQQEHGALGGTEPFEQQQERHGQRVGVLRVRGRIRRRRAGRRRIRQHRLGQPGADVGLAAAAG